MSGIGDTGGFNLIKESVKAAIQQEMAEQKSNEQKFNYDALTERKLKEDIKSVFAKNPKFAELHNQIKKENNKHPLYDLKSIKHESWIDDIYNCLMKSKLVNLTNKASILESLNNLKTFEYSCYFEEKKSLKNHYGLIFYLGIHITRSRLCILLLNEMGVKNVHLSIIVPMYKEDSRMQIDNEDFIRRKVNQLTLLFKDISPETISWDLLFVDDGCPNQSGIKAKQLIDKNKDFFKNCKDVINVALLKDGIESKDPEIAFDKFEQDGYKLTNTNDSRKGGAVQYGFYLSLKKYKNISDSHYIMFTDSDLSSNISQSGLLLYKLINSNKANKDISMVIGDRYLNTGICSGGEKMGWPQRDDLILQVRDMFRRELLPPCKNFYDTQCGFKLISHESLNKILYKIENYQSMFDMELLLTMEDEIKNSVLTEGIVWLHSLEESNFLMGNDDDDVKEDNTKISVAWAYGYYKQLQETIDIHVKRYNNSDTVNKKWVKWIKQLSEKNFYHLCQCIFYNFYTKNDGSDITKYYPSIDELNLIINKQKLPKDVPKFVKAV